MGRRPRFKGPVSRRPKSGAGSRNCADFADPKSLRGIDKDNKRIGEQLAGDKDFPPFDFPRKTPWHKQRDLIREYRLAVFKRAMELKKTKEKK